MDKPSRFCRLKDNLITPALRQLDSNFASIAIDQFCFFILVCMTGSLKPVTQ